MTYNVFGGTLNPAQSNPIRHDVLLRDILEGRMTGKCTRGRKRLQLMSNICEGYETAKKRAEDRCL